MTEEEGNSPPEENHPPSPDAPVPPESGRYAGRAGGERSKMADDVEMGRSPYNYGYDEDDERGRSTGSILSLANVAAVVSLAAVLAVGFMAWKVAGDVSGEMERLNAAVRKLSGQLRAQRDEGRAASAAAVRSELRQTLNALDGAIALGEPEAAERARELKKETLELLAILRRGQETEEAGAFVAPGSGEESPPMEESVEAEEPPAAAEKEEAVDMEPGAPLEDAAVEEADEPVSPGDEEFPGDEDISAQTPEAAPEEEAGEGPEGGEDGVVSEGVGT